VHFVLALFGVSLVNVERLFRIGFTTLTMFPLTVHPSYRRLGIGRKLLNRCVEHWNSLKCTRASVILPENEASAAHRLFQSLGFAPHNAMVVPLTTTAQREATMVTALRRTGVKGSDEYLLMLLRALPQQLDAAFGDTDAICERVSSVQQKFGTYVDPSDNLFTRNLSKMGAGNFNMSELAQRPEALAATFDRMSSRYHVWTVGNKSQVEYWISKQMRLHSPQLMGARVLDACCGIGLMAHQIKLCGFKGKVTGLDISPGWHVCCDCFVL
jgi:hypothetical protein